MGVMLLGRKVGMTRVFTEGGVLTPVTVIQLGPCTVTQVKTPARDGYAGVQVGFEDVKPRRSTIPVIGHDARAGTGPKRFHREFRVEPGQESAFTLGQVLTVKELEGQRYVDVTGTSKGKGFAGVMKRWGFKGQYATHGTERKHRSPGSIGSLCSNRGYGGGLAKGKRMAGHLGAERVTVRSLDVVRIDAERHLLLVKGPVPGANNGMVMVRPAVRLNKSKQKKVAGEGK
jgi:large subunit ribosomal protein L3